MGNSNEVDSSSRNAQSIDDVTFDLQRFYRPEMVGHVYSLFRFPLTRLSNYYQTINQEFVGNNVEQRTHKKSTI
jgi:hypothetical protein